MWFPFFPNTSGPCQLTLTRHGPIKYVQFFAYQLYLNKAVQKNEARTLEQDNSVRRQRNIFRCDFSLYLTTVGMPPYSIEGKYSLGAEAWSQNHFCRRLAVEPWAGCLTFLSLCFFNCVRSMILVNSTYDFYTLYVNITWDAMHI